MRIRITAFAASLLIAMSAFFTNAAADRLDHLPALNDPDHHVFTSETLGRPFHVYVRLPYDYDEAKDYPVVYLLDGDVLFPLIGAYQLLLEFDEPVPEVIIVGIAYGGLGRENGNYRGTDYSAPGGEREGVADQYQRFLSDELLPFVEERYPADPARRIIFGQSRGAHFVLYTALTQPTLFWGHIASNPSLQPNKAFFFEDHGHPPSTASNLFFSSGSRDWERLRTEAREWFDHWSGKADTPWRLKTVTLEGETHAAGVTNVYRAAMKWLFADEAAANNQSE